MEPTFTIEEIGDIVDSVVGVKTDQWPHHNGGLMGGSKVCLKRGCGKPWYDDEGRHHLATQVMRELQAKALE